MFLRRLIPQTHATEFGDRFGFAAPVATRCRIAPQSTVYSGAWHVQEFALDGKSTKHRSLRSMPGQAFVFAVTRHQSNTTIFTTTTINNSHNRQ